MYKWFLAWRYLHTKLIAVFGVASVMLCVAMVLVVMSVMGGFLDTIRSRSRGLHSEIVLEGGSLQGFPYYEDFSSYLSEQHGEVVRISTPTIYSYGIFRVLETKWTKPTRVVGIELDKYRQVNDFGKGLHYDKYFPESTSLAKQGITVVGLDEKTGGPLLPIQLVEANKRWRESDPPPEEIRDFEETPFEVTLAPSVAVGDPGRWCFQADWGPPKVEGPKRFGIIVGSDIINGRREDGNIDRYYARGAPVALTVLPLTSTGTLTGSPPVLIPGRYADDSRTGIFEIDSLCVYIDFSVLQSRLGMDTQELDDGTVVQARTNQLLIGLHEGVDLDEARDRLSIAWEDFKISMLPVLTPDEIRKMHRAEIMTWEEIQRPLIAAVEKEKVLVTVLFSLISIVAIVLLGCIFYMIVEKKTRDIGILKSLGASSSGVAGMFIVYAAAVGVVGSILGTLLGSVFVWNINDIQEILASLNPELRVWSAEVYSFDKIPESVKSHEAFWIAIVAVFSSMFGSLIPAILAGRVWPVQALRYE